VAVVTFVTSILVAFNVPDLTIEQVTTIIMGGASMIAYIIGEGLVDAKRIEMNKDEVAEETSITE
jgi:hypothetical protein